MRFLVTRSFFDFVMLRCCESAIFDLSAIIEIWSAIYQAIKRAHVYGAGAHWREGLAHDGAWGALRQDAEAGTGGAM
jgi:hypothetical protein